MITLKHLCREFDVDPPKLRRTMRAAKVNTNGGRYKWEDESKELKKVRAKLTQLLPPKSSQSPSPAPQ